MRAILTRRQKGSRRRGQEQRHTSPLAKLKSWVEAQVGEKLVMGKGSTKERRSTRAALLGR